MQFETDYVVQSELAIGEDLLNTKYKDKLEPSYKVINLFLFFKRKELPCEVLLLQY